MTDRTRADTAQLLADYQAGVPGAEDRLFPIVYDELRALARRKLRQDRPGHSLAPTDLVNEAYLRLARQRSARWQDRAHFMKIAARLMRRVLVDHARARLAAKRGGAAERLPLTTMVDGSTLHVRCDEVDVLALEEALEQLAEKSAPRAQVVELRFYAGLSVKETAEVLGVHEITVKRHWKFAQAWLLSRMTGGGDAP